MLFKRVKKKERESSICSYYPKLNAFLLHVPHSHQNYLTAQLHSVYSDEQHEDAIKISFLYWFEIDSYYY